MNTCHLHEGTCIAMIEKVSHVLIGSSPAYVVGLYSGAIRPAMGDAKPRQSRESGHSEYTTGFEDKAAARAGSVQK